MTLSKDHERTVVKAVLSDDRDTKVAKQEILKEVSDELELPKASATESSTSLPSLDTDATPSSTEESTKKEGKDGRWDGLYDR